MVEVLSFEVSSSSKNCGENCEKNHSPRTTPTSRLGVFASADFDVAASVNDEVCFALFHNIPFLFGVRIIWNIRLGRIHDALGLDGGDSRIRYSLGGRSACRWFILGFPWLALA